MKMPSLMAVMFVSMALAGHTSRASEPVQPPDEGKQVRLASALVEYGMEARDPLALANAAKMFRSFSARVLERGETGKDGKSVDAYDLLDKAREFAQGDENLLAVIETVANTEPGSKYGYNRTCFYEWYVDYFGNWVYRWVCY